MSRRNGDILMDEEDGSPAHYVFFGFDGFNVSDADGDQILHVSATPAQMYEAQKRIEHVLRRYKFDEDNVTEATDDEWERELS